MSIKYNIHKTTEESTGLGETVITTRYNTLSDFIQSLREFSFFNPDHMKESYSVNNQRDEFCGGTINDAFSVDNSKLNDSITDFSDAARAVTEKLEEQYTTPPVYNMEVTGECYDVAEVLNGRPECWFSLPEQKQKRLDIVYNTAIYGGMTRKIIFNRGACFLGLLDALKAAGVNLSLQMVHYSYFIRLRKYTRLMLNLDVETVSPETLRFICCNALFPRRLSFYEKEIMLKTTALKRHGYGDPYTYKPEKIENDTLVISRDFEPSSLDDGARKIAAALENCNFGSGEPQIFTI